MRVMRKKKKNVRVGAAVASLTLQADDSGSMRFEEHGLRIKAMRTFMKGIAKISCLFDPDGVAIRFLNHSEKFDSVTQEATIDRIVSRVSFSGGTQIGTQLKKKIIDPLVVKPAQAGRLKKPVLVIIVTDGEPTGEDPGALKSTILYAMHALNKTDYTDAAVAFQIAQVGNDRHARAFIRGLDKDAEVGHHFGNVAEEGIERLEAKAADEDFDHDLWLVKMMVGAVDKTDLGF
ncbi:hypothetical protein F5Y17DRAFT_427993 [Xylariaceae sp. FL0594]|nr:hypothetical protein F5Y17DRAFT_427993 [Xylariaceae sp. FL0594]